jgi:hypothetical protein
MSSQKPAESERAAEVEAETDTAAKKQTTDAMTLQEPVTVSNIPPAEVSVTVDPKS